MNDNANRNRIKKVLFDPTNPPTELVSLPSKGLLYPDWHPLHKMARVPIRGMRVSDEEILLNVAFAKLGCATIELLKRCVSVPGFNQLEEEDLLAGDISALLYGIRINSYGAVLDPKIKCPSCEHENKLEVNLSSLSINTLDLVPIEPYSNEFEYMLPKSGHIITFGFLSFDKEREITSMVQEDGPTLSKKTYVTTLLKNSIKSVNGNRNQNVLNSFIHSMKLGDSMAFRSYLSQNEPTILASINFACQECHFEQQINLPKDQQIFGMSPENKSDIVFEPHFIMTYYAGFTWSEYVNYPVAYRKKFMDRIQEELNNAADKNSDIPSKAPQHNTPETRALLGKTKAHTPNSKMQRF